jgi:hypothetical protein
MAQIFVVEMVCSRMSTSQLDLSMRSEMETLKVGSF